MTKCTLCGENKDQQSFYKRKDGTPRKQCKGCSKFLAAERWRNLEPDVRRALNLRNLEWQRANPDSVRNKNLKRKYGITLKERNALLEKQLYLCAICEENQDNGRLHVDHNHETGAIRGLLCRKCNLAIGMFREDISILRSAVAYLG